MRGDFGDRLSLPRGDTEVCPVCRLSEQDEGGFERAVLGFSRADAEL